MISNQIIIVDNISYKLDIEISLSSDVYILYTDWEPKFKSKSFYDFAIINKLIQKDTGWESFPDEIKVILTNKVNKFLKLIVFS